MRLQLLRLGIVMAQLFSQASHATSFKKTILTIDGHRLNVEVAESTEQRSLGLMYRRKLAKDAGMIFIFEEEEPKMDFWMKNTFIPLSIGFFNKAKELVDVQEMQPVHSEMEKPQTYASRAPAMYALEVNPGWFTKNKIKLGARFTLKSDVQKKSKR